MSEYSLAAPEKLPETIQAFDELTNPAALEAYDQRITHEVATFDYESEKREMHAREDELMHGLKKLQSLGFTPQEPDDYEEQIRGFSSELRAIDKRLVDARTLHDFQATRERRWRERGVLTFDNAEDEVSSLVAVLEQKAVRQEQPFMPDEAFKAHIDAKQPVVVITSAHDEAVLEFPTASFVSATGFSSWEEGRRNFYKDGRTSVEVIADYASRETEIPPVDVAQALLLPNGEVILLSENAHRVAAAKRKGQPMMAVKEIEVYRATVQ